VINVPEPTTVHEVALKEHEHQHKGQDRHRSGQEQLVQVDRLRCEESNSKISNGTAT
jgi:hypothetical protein